MSKHYKLFLNAGRGFHSNDARSVVQDKAAHQLPSAWGGEVGFQAHIRPANEGAGVLLSAVLWGLDLDNELVFIGDEGTTENNGASRRVGLDLSIRSNLTDWLFFDADVNFSKGRLLDKSFGKILPSDNLIPLAPNVTSTGGLTVHLPCGKGQIEGALRYRFVGERAANEANTVRALGYKIVDMTAFYKTKRYNVGISVENLLNTAWNEAQFDTESRLQGEANAVSELHFTPGTPLSIKLTFGINF